MRPVLLVAAVAFLFAAAPGVAAADTVSGWLPHSADATWEYTWSDSVYNTTPTKEKVTVKSTNGPSFTLGWTTVGENNPDGAPSSTGTVSFVEQNYGIVNTDWSSDAPPSNFPILCAQSSQCGNSLVGTYYNLIWGSRTPVLFEPLLQGTTWSTTGGAAGDVASTNDYIGTQMVSVPAFPQPVEAAVIQSQITQAGALGDPYGSGTRTVWWVYGVGPVKIEFDHAGGTGAPVTIAMLDATNQMAEVPPPDTDYFPLTVGVKNTYRWTNAKHLAKPEVESTDVAQVSNDSAELTVKSVSGPIKVAAAYAFTLRTNGLTTLWATTKASTLAKFPPLGPAALPVAKRRHFFTPFDLMTFGFNPIITAYPKAGDTWGETASNADYRTYGVTGWSTVIGVQTVKVPAGKFKTLEVRSVMTQKGFPFGSGTRTAWFAPKRGLVKLEFRHGDGSTSEVVLIK